MSTQPEFKVNREPTIGNPPIKIYSVDSQSEIMKALLDIYSELQRISVRVNTPWYRRLWDWTKDLWHSITSQ